MRFCFNIFFVSVIISTTAYGQLRLSPKLQTKNLRETDHEMFLSVSVKEKNSFTKKYLDRITIHYSHKNIFYITAGAEFLDDAVTDSNIIFIDRSERAAPEANFDFFNTSYNRINKVHAKYPTLLGGDQNISIKEKSFDTTDIDLINRNFKTEVSPPEVTQHATSMATLIAGAGNSSPKNIGAAPEANITSSNFDRLLPDADEIFTGHNIHLQNHSYGVLIENYYGNEAQAYDDQIFNHPSLLHIFSAGNLGHFAPADGTYKNLPFANLSGNFKQAKNILSITAVDTTFMSNSLNSRGPAFDGRLKPELTAYGQGGTSEAAALTTGVCALLQQKFAATNGTLPWASTVKAALIASADDLGNEGIDYTYGYGNVNAYKAVNLIDHRFISEISLNSNETKTIDITAGDSIAMLKVAVVWTDPPALQNSTKALTHDIESIVTIGDQIIYPWILSAFPNVDSLSAPAKRGQDHLNNVEFFSIQNPPAGLVSVQIKAPALTTSSQNVSIAVWFEKKTFQWDYPNKQDIVKANSREELFWNYPDSGAGTIYLQLNDGEWQLLAGTAELSASRIRWTVPDTLARALVKMVIENEEYVSDTFMISPEPQLHVAYNCDTRALLSWPRIARADAYQIFALGEKYLEPKAITSDTTFSITKSDNAIYFAIAPVLSGSAALRSAAINYADQGALCYINLFSAERFESSTVTVQLALSTVIDVDQINIYKTMGGSTSLLAEFPPGENTMYQISDSKLQPGAIQYEAEIILKNGNKITSATAEVLIETKNQIVLYPNPIFQDETLYALSEGNGITIEIFNDMGQRVMSSNLQLTVEVIAVEHLLHGIYFYHAISNGKVIDTGKFIRN